MHAKDPVVIVAIARTPIGKMLGQLKDFTAVQLGAHVIQALVKKTEINLQNIDEVIMGCVLPAGLGQAPARQAALKAGLAQSTLCTTINKVCGSGMKALMIAADSLRNRQADVVIAGGMESMSNAPYLLKQGRQGYRFGHAEIFDHMALDGLEDAYETGSAMGVFADRCAAEFNFTREQQDAFALDSFKRALAAQQNHVFREEIVPIEYVTKNATITITEDEHPHSVKLEKLPQLKAAFSPTGTVTAGNASAIADGAAALMLMRESTAIKLQLKPLARIIDYVAAAKQPDQFTTAPIDAINKLLHRQQWQSSDVDLYEINEAFAVVAMACMQALNIPHEKINVNGGACALGHPIGASGARIIVTLLAALRQHQLKRGIAALCIGGGEATAMALEVWEA